MLVFGLFIFAINPRWDDACHTFSYFLCFAKRHRESIFACRRGTVKFYKIDAMIASEMKIVCSSRPVNWAAKQPAIIIVPIHTHTLGKK